MSWPVGLTDPYALSFDGTTSFGIATDSASLNTLNNRFSVAFWLWLTAYDNNVLPRVWEKRSNYMAIMGDSGNGRFRNLAIEVVNTGATAVEYWGRTRLDVNQWYRVIGTFDGNVGGDVQGIIYLNGVAETMTRILGPWTGTLQDTTGFDLNVARRRTDLLRNLQGRLDSFQFFADRVITPAEAAADMYAPITAASADWRMAEGSGSSTADSSGNNNTLALTSTSWLVAQGQLGQYATHVSGPGMVW
jgi:Concanavalin A-like lectin/glucanases superfamily